MALYNGSEYVEEQLKSILIQLSDADEIIISDDGSTDDSLKIVQGLDDDRIRLIKNESTNNLILNFENALKHARGKYLFLSDQDDVWEPHKIHTMLMYLEDYDLVVCDCSVINRNGIIINDSYFKLRGSGTGLIKNLIKNRYVGCCMAFNRFVLNKSLPFPKTIPMHDWWIGMVAEAFGKPFFCGKPLVKYRRHDKNASPFIKYNQYGFFEKVGFRMNLCWVLFKLFFRPMNRMSF